jgi:DNA mismatch repair protein MutS2
MDTKILQTLEYHKIIDKLLAHTHTSLSRELAEGLRPEQDIESVQQLLRETEEAAHIDRLKSVPPFGGIRGIQPSLARARIGGMLSASELLDVATTAQGGRRLKRFILSLDEAHDRFPIIAGLASSIEDLRPLEDEILRCIGEQGEVVDSASPELSRIRSSIRTLEARVREKLDQMVKNPSIQKKLQDPIVTLRNNRYCLPVKQEYRAHFGGIVHDQSASGATLFIEPEAVVHMNNDLRELRLKEEREIEKILQRLSGLVGEHVDELTVNIRSIARLDFIFAKALLAREMKASYPKMNDRGYIRLRKGRHPLIDPEKVVPIDVELGGSYRTIIITGPNTGGKTVTLKTIGLLSLMAASGLFVPAEDGAELAVFDAVFADIGDEQSIEQSLSTFSSHMTNIIRILNQMTSRSLILLDEVGAGTDPTEGSALAIAILDHIHRTGARTVATTHYSELKAYAFNTPGIMNASMEFDVKSLRPTYRLLLGVPGRSNALAIAERLGLDKSIIEASRQHLTSEEQQVDSMIASLEENRLTAENERIEAEKLHRQVKQLQEQLEAERQRFEEQKGKLLERAEREAAEAVRKAKQEADEIIAELRRMAMEERASLKEHRFIEMKKRLEEAAPSLVPDRKTRRPGQSGRVKVEPGDEVTVLSVGQKGHVIEAIGSDEYMVQLGIIKMKVHRDDLQPLKREPAKPLVQTGANVKRSKDTPVRTELDLRGSTLEEALIEADRFLDEAIMSNLGQVAFIHGKGTGVLRNGIQEFLRKHRHVKSFRLGEYGEGGSGITIAELK